MTTSNLPSRSPKSLSSQPFALQIFDTVPKGCRLVLVRDGYNFPHLQVGDFAVVDLSDREFEHGGLYLVNWKDPPTDICQVIMERMQGSDGPFWGAWFRPMNKHRRNPDGTLDLTGPMYMSEGPLNPNYLPEKLAGRVVGIYRPPEVDRCLKLTGPAK